MSEKNVQKITVKELIAFLPELKVKGTGPEAVFKEMVKKFGVGRMAELTGRPLLEILGEVTVGDLFAIALTD